MAEIVNLRSVRKAKARSDAERQADRNRIAFGRTRAERDAAKAERERQQRALDGTKRDD